MNNNSVQNSTQFARVISSMKIDDDYETMVRDRARSGVWYWNRIFSLGKIAKIGFV